MGKKGSTTISGTSVDDIYSKILTAYIEQEQKKIVLSGKRKSKAQTIEDAILLLLERRGVFEKVLTECGVPIEEIERTKQRLKIEYGNAPKP